MNIEIQALNHLGKWVKITGTDVKMDFVQTTYDPPMSKPIVVYTDFDLKFKSNDKVGRIKEFKYFTDKGHYYQEPIKVKKISKKAGIVTIEFKGLNDFVLPGFEKAKK